MNGVSSAQGANDVSDVASDREKGPGAPRALAWTAKRNAIAVQKETLKAAKRHRHGGTNPALSTLYGTLRARLEHAPGDF